MEINLRQLCLTISLLLISFSISSSQELGDDPLIADTIYVDSVVSTSATRGFVPVYFYNDEELAGIELTLNYDSPNILVDSFSFVSGRLETFTLKGSDQLQSGTITIYSFALSEGLIPSGSGLMGYLYFSYLPNVTEHLVTIDTVTITIDEREFSTSFSDASANFFKPEFESGYLHIQPTSCCLGDRGNVNGSPNDEFDISDLVYLVNYMFKEGPEPVCMEEANVNGSLDEQFDIADVTYLTRFMFKDGPPPATCP